MKMTRNHLSINRFLVRLRTGLLPIVPLCLIILTLVPATVQLAILAAVVAGGLVLYLKRKLKSASLIIAPIEENHRKQIDGDEVSKTASLEIKIGCALFPLVESQNGEPLISRVADMRSQISKQLGFSVPHIPIKVDLSLEPNRYRILIAGLVVGEDMVWPDDILALDDGNVDSIVAGRPCKDPTFGMNSLWIREEKKSGAITEGYILVDAPSVIVTHLSDVVRRHAAKLLGNDEVQRLIDSVKGSSPLLADGLISERLSQYAITSICRDLLAENVPLKDFRRIALAMVEASSLHSETAPMVEKIRQEIGDLIVHVIVPLSMPLPVITLDTSFESLLVKAIKRGEYSSHPFDRFLAERMIEAVNIASRSLPLECRGLALVTSPVLRRSLRAMLKLRFPDLSVLSNQELPSGKSIEVLARIGLPSSSQTMAVTNSDQVQ